MRKKVTLTALFACVFALCLTAFVAISAPQANADGETYTLKFLPAEFDRELSTSGLWDSIKNHATPPVENEEGGVTMSRPEGTTGNVNYYLGYNNRFNVEQGKTYIVSFKAKGSVTGVLFPIAPQLNADGTTNKESYGYAKNLPAASEDYVETSYEYTVTGASGASYLLFQLRSGTGDLYVKDFRYYEKIEKSVTAGEAIGELPAITEKAGYVGRWKIDGKAVTSDTVYNYGGDKTAEIVYKEARRITFLSDDYDYDIASSTESWYVNDNVPVPEISGGEAAMKRADSTVTYYAGRRRIVGTKGAVYKISFKAKSADGVRFAMFGISMDYNSENKLAEKWDLLTDKTLNGNEYSDFEFEFTAHENGNVSFAVQLLGGTGTLTFKEVRLYEKIVKNAAIGEAIGELPEIPVKDRYADGYWAVDGKEISADTVCDYDGDKVAKIVRKRLYDLALVSDDYYYDMASSTESWKHYNVPEMNEEGGATLTRSADVASGTAVNYLGGEGKYRVTEGKTYVVTFSMKCDNVHMNIALNSPQWTLLHSAWINNTEYKDYKLVYTCDKSGQATVIFQLDAGSGKIYLKNLRFYESFGEKTLTEDEALSEVPAIDKVAKHGYKWAWMAGETEVKNGDLLTADTVATPKEIALTPAHVIKEVSQKAATCEEAGYKKHYACETCGEYFLDAEGYEAIEDINEWKNGDGKEAALGHDLTKVDGLAATCTTDGYKESYVCSVCNEAFADENAEKAIANIDEWKVGEGRIAAKGHDTEEVEGVAATCTADGVKKYYECKVCNACFKDAEAAEAIEDVEGWKAGEGKLAAKGHTPAEAWTSDGENHWHVCEVCEIVLEESKAAHTFGDGEITTPATCKEEGVKTFTCEVCGKTKTESVAKIAHSYDEGKITKPATCKEEGVKTFTCSVCKETKTEKIEKIAHKESSEWSKDENGHWHVCEVCNEKLSEAAHKDDDKNGKCDVCGAEVKGETPSESGKDSTKDSGSSSGSGKGCSSGLNGAMGTLAFMAIAAFVVKKRGKKE